MELQCDAGHIFRKGENSNSKDMFTSVYMVALFIVAKTWKTLNCPSQMIGLRRCGIDIQWNITQQIGRPHV